MFRLPLRSTLFPYTTLFRSLARPEYEDALYFGAAYPDVQRERPVVFLHEPWLGFFGRRDVVCLWTNAGRRELGLVGFDDPRARDDRLAFVRRDEPKRASFVDGH